MWYSCGIGVGEGCGVSDGTDVALGSGVEDGRSVGLGLARIDVIGVCDKNGVMLAASVAGSNSPAVRGASAAACPIQPVSSMLKSKTNRIITEKFNRMARL
jgi:hypothetical protein